jgi:hypothetical protein
VSGIDLDNCGRKRRTLACRDAGEHRFKVLLVFERTSSALNASNTSGVNVGMRHGDMATLVDSGTVT